MFCRRFTQCKREKEKNSKLRSFHIFLFLILTTQPHCLYRLFPSLYDLSFSGSIISLPFASYLSPFLYHIFFSPLLYRLFPSLYAFPFSGSIIFLFLFPLCSIIPLFLSLYYLLRFLYHLSLPFPLLSLTLPLPLLSLPYLWYLSSPLSLFLLLTSFFSLSPNILLYLTLPCFHIPLRLLSVFLYSFSSLSLHYISNTLP